MYELDQKLGVVDQQLLKTANRKQQNADNVLWLVENCDIKLEILHKLNPFEPITDPDNCDVRAIFWWSFSLGHVIITTVINICNATQVEVHAMYEA